MTLFQIKEKSTLKIIVSIHGADPSSTVRGQEHIDDII